MVVVVCEQKLTFFKDFGTDYCYWFVEILVDSELCCSRMLEGKYRQSLF